ncbi:hypothetical protein FHS60_002005 [Alloprevotella rava]|uniref:Uncharacterized protein n=1 Tax=Alloprevotella rava TaxID=671218 RepID=A0A7W5UFV5_9BACT|nr:hypothetical protein [Alloprevotella rava]
MTTMCWSWKNEKEVGKLSVVSGIDDKGKLQTTEATAANQAAFLTFNGRDELLKNFMTNFFKQFNEPSRFGLYKVLASNVEQGVEGLRGMLLNKDSAENKQKFYVFAGREEMQFPRSLRDCFCPSTLAVRRFLRRSPLCPLPHGFTLALARASPTVKHSAPPPEAGLHEDNAYNLEEEKPPLQEVII